ncbi:C6 zinc finger domain protein [Botrytis cinerea]
MGPSSGPSPSNSALTVLKCKDTPNISREMTGLYKGSSSLSHLCSTGLDTAQDIILVILRNYVPLDGTGFETPTSLVQSPRVLSPIHPSSWLVHVEGVGKMFQLSPPDLFASGIEHTLFIGFRPLLILRAFILRVAACIPGILERVDMSMNGPYTASVEIARDRITELIDSKAGLQAWHSSYLKSSSTPLYWRRRTEAEVEKNVDLWWFRDLSTANVFIYFWAFQIICLIDIHSLFEKYPEVEQSVLN